MPLQVYTSSDGITPLSTESSFSNPLTTIHDGTNGTIIEEQLFLRRDDSDTYSGILITPKSDDDSVYIGSGANAGTQFGVKVWAGIQPPTLVDWLSVNYGAALTMGTGSPPIIDSDSPQEFWLRIESAAGLDVATVTGIYLEIYYQ